MKVLLLKPNVQSDGIQPVLGLGYLATQIRNSNEVTILDGVKENLTIRKLQAFIRSISPDLVGIQALTTDLPVINGYLKAIREINPGALLIVGGPHSSSVGAEALSVDLPGADFAWQGEAEIGLPKLLGKIPTRSGASESRNRDGNRQSDGLSLTEIPGLIYRSGGMIKANPPLFVEDLDGLGMPAWDLLKPENYPPAPHGGFYRRFPVAPINISRGCPCNCYFCSAGLVSGTRIRYRGVSHVLEEIKRLYREHQVREIHIIDDNFTYDRNYVLGFCEALRKAGVDITWTCPNGVRADTLDREVLLSMKESGCYEISLGIESGSDRILGFLNKNISTGLVRDKIELINQIGMDVNGFFILGFPTETREEIKNTMDFSRSIKLKKAQYVLLHPFRGTDLYKKMIGEGRGNAAADTMTSYADPVYAPEGITLKQIKNLQREAFLKFYLRPRYFFSLLKEIRSPGHLFYFLRRIKRWLL